MTRPLEEHERRRDELAREVARLERRATTISMARLVLFLGGAIVLGAGLAQGSGITIAAGAGTFLAFVIAVIAHVRTIALRDAAQTRHEVHVRHVMRLTGRWIELPAHGEGLASTEHPYAWDIDLVGGGSLYQRIDVTHTRRGESILADWLGSAAEAQTIRERQGAVRELAADVVFRQELEAAALAAGDSKLDATPFLAFTDLPSLFARKRWLAPAIIAIPIATGLAYLLGTFDVLPGWAWLVPFVCGLIVMRVTARDVRAALDLAAARRGFAEAFEKMMIAVERARFESPALVAIQKRMAIGDVPPSSHMRRLDRWIGFADLRTQFLLYIFVNPLVLWDLHCLWRLERWNSDVGPRARVWFDALGEMEALCSLATLAFGDPSSTYPEIVASDAGGPFEAVELAHPLLDPATRVANDVSLTAPGTLLIVTGSNMAGKSTLLRAIGTNIALALAGGPVSAKSMRVPIVRLRASMRADDSLQRGASYFQAELIKLRRVVEHAEAKPPVLFLLDELLRGTNAHARHIGARAVVIHLLDRGAMGFVATHDVALASLENEHPGRVRNAHFTDVMEDGEMKFDYRLRPGVVKTSNALRLLRMAGIEVADDTAVSDEGAAGVK